jgi:transmembrane sensor
MNPQASADERARLEAAEWFARLNSRTISTAALKDFRTWRSDPANAAAYAEQEALWKAAGRLQDDPEIGAAVRAALAQTPKRRGFAAWLTSPPPRLRLAIFAALGLCALLAAWALLSTQAGETYRSGLGERRIVRLEDGSQVRLDTDTQLAVRFGKSSRKIELLRGQAFFDVAHDPSRPFTVRADGTEVLALGTRFDVRRDAGIVRVILLEGRVQVRRADGDGRWTMAPGEQLRLTEAATTTLPTVNRIDAAAATSWTTGRLTFRAMPLAEAIAEVNRYDRRKITLDAADLASRPVNGEFESGDTEAFVTAVADLLGLEIDRSGEGEIVLRRPGPGQG